MMVTLTHDAQGHLERYLRQVRAALRGYPSVDASEVERDVLGHIDAELTGQPEPIETSSLRQVLDRLGRPDTWVPSEDLPAWRRTFNRFRSGPEDWRLAYLTFALFIAAPTLFIGGPILWPLPPVLMAAGFLMARATVALLAEHDEPVGPRRWLIYPPLLVWYLPAAVVLVAWPVPPTIVAVTDVPVIENQLARLFSGPFWVAWVVAPAMVALSLGIWWVLLGLLLGRFTRVVHLVFRPFADWFHRRHARRVALTGLILVVTSGAILLVMLLLPVTVEASAAPQSTTAQPAVVDRLKQYCATVVPK